MSDRAIAREYVAHMEQNATSSVGFCEEPKGHAVPRTGGGLRRVGLLTQSSCWKLLWISLVADQLPTASAESICRAFNSIGENFDLIGVISAFGTAAATKSLKYSALNDSHFYATGHVGPGVLNVAAALYEATGFPLARLLAFGGSVEDKDSLAKLGSTEGLRYIGLKSNTECSLLNAVGETIVQEHNFLWPAPVKPEENQEESRSTAIVEGNQEENQEESRSTVTVEGNQADEPTPAMGEENQEESRSTVTVEENQVNGRTPLTMEENQEESRSTVTVDRSQANGIVQETQAERPPQRKRPTTVIVLQAEEPQNPVEVVSLKAPKWSALIFGWLPLALTIAVIVSCCFCKLWFVAGLLLFGTLSMMIAVLGLRSFCHFKYSQVKLEEDRLPEGDILVVDDADPDVLSVVKGREATIQKLFQRHIVFEASYGKCILFLAASMLYMYVLVSLLYMSNVSTSGQIHFAIANLIGLVADMAKASLNGKLALAKKACEEFGIKLHLDLEPLVFDNRTEAMAFVAAHASDPSILKSKKLIPSDGPAWEEWWARLARKCDTPPAPPRQNVPDPLLPMIRRNMDKGLAQFRQRYSRRISPVQ